VDGRLLPLRIWGPRHMSRCKVSAQDAPDPQRAHPRTHIPSLTRVYTLSLSLTGFETCGESTCAKNWSTLLAYVGDGLV
jgi:hypothetical protein